MIYYVVLREVNMNKNTVKYLEMIQTVINRLASNSFQFKGWFITLIVAVNIFDLNQAPFNKICVIILTTTIFLFMDVYYLYLERLYRKLYNAVLLGKMRDFDMNINLFKSKRLYFKTYNSISAYPYYLVLLFILLWKLFK